MVLVDLIIGGRLRIKDESLSISENWQHYHFYRFTQIKPFLVSTISLFHHSQFQCSLSSWVRKALKPTNVCKNRLPCPASRYIGRRDTDNNARLIKLCILYQNFHWLQQFLDWFLHIYKLWCLFWNWSPDLTEHVSLERLTNLRIYYRWFCVKRNHSISQVLMHLSSLVAN